MFKGSVPIGMLPFWHNLLMFGLFKIASIIGKAYGIRLFR